MFGSTKMMKWGRRKAKPSSSPLRTSSISHIFPTSWISKLKPKVSKNSEPKLVKEKQKVNVGTPSNWRVDGRFYGRDDEPYWRLSFGDERVDGEKICRRGEGKWRKMGELTEVVEVEKEENWKELEEPRRNHVRCGKLRKSSQGVLEKKREGHERKPEEAEEIGKILKQRDVFELLEPMRTNQEVLPSNFGKTMDEDCGFKPLKMDEKSSKRRKSKGTKIQGALSKNEKQRKSFHKSRKRGVVFRASSPRTVARVECKIKAIEDMKTAKMKTKTKRKTHEGVGRRRSTPGFDSSAVVKSSVDPQWDFRCSMIEMIMEKGIWRSEELVELLACYLTLNADEYHGIIIKVFRQVWFELNQECFSSESQNELLT